MSMYDLASFNIITNSKLWKIDLKGDESEIMIQNNAKVDHVSGLVALFGPKLKNYTMDLECKFLGHHLTGQQAGWFGVVIRAMDLNNYELIWFMPHDNEKTFVAHLPVAHGIVPWWTEAYENQHKSVFEAPHRGWFHAQVKVDEHEMTLSVNEEAILKRKFSYYLEEGYPGIYVGTATDASFKEIKIIAKE